MFQSFLATFERSWPFLLDGFQITIESWVVSIILGMVIGLFACLMKISKVKVLNVIANFYIWLIRGTPMIVQALLVYFGLPQVIPGFLPSPFMAGIITLSLNAGDFWALGGAFCFGLYSLFMRRRPEGISPLGFNVAVFALGLLCSLPFTLAEAVLLPLPRASAPVVVSVLYTGVGCSFLSFWFWTLAIDRIGPVRAGIVYYSLPVFAAAASALILGESIVGAQIVGGTLVVGGIVAATLRSPHRNRQ